MFKVFEDHIGGLTVSGTRLSFSFRRTAIIYVINKYIINYEGGVVHGPENQGTFTRYSSVFIFYFILFYKILLKLFPNEITLVFKFEDYDY